MTARKRLLCPAESLALAAGPVPRWALLRPVNLADSHGVVITEEMLQIIAASYSPATEEAPINRDHEWGGDALGWIERVELEDGILWGYPRALAPELVQEIRAERRKRISVELSLKHQLTGNPYLDGVAVLGNVKPAVKGLPAIAAEEGSATILDATGGPMPKLDPNLITLERGEGTALTATGAAGASPPGAALSVLNRESSATWSGSAGEDGAFSIGCNGGEGDTLEISGTTAEGDALEAITMEAPAVEAAEPDPDPPAAEAAAAAEGNASATASAQAAELSQANAKLEAELKRTRRTLAAAETGRLLAGLGTRVTPGMRRAGAAELLTHLALGETGSVELAAPEGSGDAPRTVDAHQLLLDVLAAIPQLDALHPAYLAAAADSADLKADDTSEAAAVNDRHGISKTRLMELRKKYPQAYQEGSP